jgi:hypothetical protein
MKEDVNIYRKHRYLWYGYGGVSLFLVLVFWAGCSKPAVPITVVDQRKEMMKKCSRIDIEKECVEQGLGQLFSRIAEKYGPFESEAIIRDYTPLIQQGLYFNGFCMIQNLNINGETFDIDIFFLTEQNPSSLNLVAFVKGNANPVISLSNRYYVSPQ